MHNGIALRRAGATVAAALVAVLVAIPAQATSVTFSAAADAMVTSANPSTNYGASTRIQVDASPTVRSYLRFTVQGISGSVAKATLQLKAVDASSKGFQVRPVTNTTWGEASITYRNAPAMSAVLANSGSFGASAWASVNVTSIVSGNGTYSFAVTTTSSTRTRFFSKEGGNAPRLIVETGTDATAPPRPTGVKAAGVDFNWVKVSWPASLDAGVAGYTVYRGGVALGTVDGDTLEYADTTAGPAKSYDYQVDAFDAAAKRSSKSTSVSITTAGLPSYPVIAAAGDIACDPGDGSFNGGSGTSDDCRQKYTSNSLVNAKFTAVLPLGDNQYDSGVYNDFLPSYDPSWGRVKSITRPAPGNHEYETSGGAGYYQYFGVAAGDPAKGYYSYNLGTWHLIALNSNISRDANSAQVAWLQSDLAANSKTCILAYWHHPRWSSGPHGSNSSVAPFWDVLYAGNADVVLVGHDHDYERFAQQNSSGVADPSRGIREFVVGTGGRSHYGFSSIKANSQVRESEAYGILMLKLQSSSYSWRFVPEPGGTFTDSSSTACH